MAAAYPAPIQNIINRGQVPKIKATRVALDLDYGVANTLLQRIMDLVYKRAIKIVIDAPVNYEHSLLVEQIEQIHKEMYDYVGDPKTIGLDILMGLQDPSEAGKVVRQKKLITDLFGSMDQINRIEAFGGIVGIKDPERLQIRFGSFYPGSDLHAIFIENAEVVPNAPVDAVQYHMTIGPVIELDGMAQGYHMTNYFYKKDPHGAQRTFYRNNGYVLENKAASRAETERRKDTSDRIKAALEAARAPLTPKRRKAMNIVETLRAPKSAPNEAETAGASAAAAVPMAEFESVFDQKGTVIYTSIYTLDTKPRVRMMNGAPMLTVRLMDKSGKVIAILALGNLMHYGAGFYSAEVLNADNIPFRSIKGRKYIINFDDTDIPTPHRMLLAGAEEVRCSNAASGGASAAASGGASAAASGGGGGESVCITPKGEPLAVYLMREDFSRTPLGDALYNLLIAHFSNMPTSPKKLDINSALFQVVDVLTNPEYASELSTSPELNKFQIMLGNYNLYDIFSVINKAIIAIYDNASPSETQQELYAKYRAIASQYPPIPIEDLDLVERNTYVTDPDIHYSPPLYSLIQVIKDMEELIKKIPKATKAANTLRRRVLYNTITEQIHDAVSKTPNSHPSVRKFKEEIIDKTSFGSYYISKYKQFRGKQDGGGIRRNTLRRRSNLRFRTRKAY
jgi:hypothetical protein